MRQWNRRVTVRPSKADATMQMVVGLIFVCIGIFVVIPKFGPFGILWTLLAAVITIRSGYLAFGKKYVGPEIHVEESSQRAQAPVPSQDRGVPANGIGLTPEERLQQLQRLFESGLITNEEFEAKRQEILQDL